MNYSKLAKRDLVRERGGEDRYGDNLWRMNLEGEASDAQLADLALLRDYKGTNAYLTGLKRQRDARNARSSRPWRMSQRQGETLRQILAEEAEAEAATTTSTNNESST